jgi:hypothetical protein
MDDRSLIGAAILYGVSNQVLKQLLQMQVMHLHSGGQRV